MKWSATIVLAVAAVSACKGEPRYEGRSLDAWIADLKSPDAETRRHAMEACAAMGPGAEAAIPALVDALKAKGPVSPLAGVALSRMGPKAYPAVVPVTQSTDPKLRREAVRTIGKLAESRADGGAGNAELLRHLTDPDEDVRAVAAAYLGII